MNIYKTWRIFDKTLVKFLKCKRKNDIINKSLPNFIKNRNKFLNLYLNTIGSNNKAIHIDFCDKKLKYIASNLLSFYHANYKTKYISEKKTC